MFNLRPCEFLGIRVGVILDYRKPNGEYDTLVSTCLSIGLLGCAVPLRVFYPKERVTFYNDKCQRTVATTPDIFYLVTFGQHAQPQPAFHEGTKNTYPCTVTAALSDS